jgi:hypothetical protein
MRTDLSKLRVGDILGVAAILDPRSIVIRAITGGKASHVAQVMGDPHHGNCLAEMLATHTDRRYFDPQNNALMTVDEWRSLPTTAMMEACTQVDIRTGLEVSNLGKYQPNHNPFHTRVVWVRRHPVYESEQTRTNLTQRCMRMFVSGVKYDYGELFSFLDLGRDHVGEYICSELPLKNLLADGGTVPDHYRIQCSPSDYERWKDWVDVTDEVKE